MPFRFISRFQRTTSYNHWIGKVNENTSTHTHDLYCSIKKVIENANSNKIDIDDLRSLLEEDV